MTKNLLGVVGFSIMGVGLYVELVSDKGVDGMMGLGIVFAGVAFLWATGDIK